MTVRSAVPDSPDRTPLDLSEGDLATLLTVLEQVRQARADQREALRWLAESTVPRATA